MLRCLYTDAQTACPRVLLVVFSASSRLARISSSRKFKSTPASNVHGDGGQSDSESTPKAALTGLVMRHRAIADTVSIRDLVLDDLFHLGQFETTGERYWQQASDI